MARACSICAHPQRSSIDAAISAGTPLRRIIEQIPQAERDQTSQVEHARSDTCSASRSDTRSASISLGALARHKAHAAPATSALSAPIVPETEQALSPRARRQSGVRCTVCHHPHRREIDAALVANTSSGRSIARQYGLHPSAVQRHSIDHLPAQLVQAEHVEAVASASGLLLQIQNLQAEAAALLERAKDAGDIRAAAAVLAQQGRFIELLAKVEGQLPGDGATVNVLVSPDWTRIRSAILAALAPHSEARLAVAAALEGAP